MLSLLILISLFSMQAYSIELILNGNSYDIDDYKIAENGKKIIIDNVPLKHKELSSAPKKIIYKSKCNLKKWTNAIERKKSNSHKFRSPASDKFVHSYERKQIKTTRSNAFIDVEKLKRQNTVNKIEESKTYSDVILKRLRDYKNSLKENKPDYR